MTKKGKKRDARRPLGPKQKTDSTREKKKRECKNGKRDKKGDPHSVGGRE